MTSMSRGGLEHKRVDGPFQLEPIYKRPICIGVAVGARLPGPWGEAPKHGAVMYSVTCVVCDYLWREQCCVDGKLETHTKKMHKYMYTTTSM